MAKYELSKAQEAKIASMIKAVNTRITQLGKTYKFDSSIYKQEVGKFEKGAYKEFVRYTEPKARGRNVQKQKEGKWKAPESHIAFDTKAIMNQIRTEGLNSKTQTLLAELLGVKVKPTSMVGSPEEGWKILDMTLQELKGAGVPTVTQVDKRITKRLEKLGEDWTQMSKKQIRREGENLYEFSENFQTTYETYMAKFGEEEARGDTVIQRLYGDFRDKQLTYPELERIKQRMQDRIDEAANEALGFENENTNEL